MAYAHDRHIIHRDLKPGNMIIRTDGRAMIFDFGLAAAVYAHDNESTPLHAEGTPPYLAPEQATGATPSPAADIYSLGAILYEILNGEPLYRFHQLAGPTAKIDAIRNPPPRPRLAIADASQSLEDILDKALALAPEDRFPPPPPSPAPSTASSPPTSSTSPRTSGIPPPASPSPPPTGSSRKS